MSLREKQSLFAHLLAQLILWINSQGWEVTLADVGVSQKRKVTTSEGKKLLAIDREHMPNSLHYVRLAADLNLFVGDQWITNGDDPAWSAIGARWEAMNPLCRWGGRFTNPDANHVSLAHEGRA